MSWHFKLPYMIIIPLDLHNRKIVMKVNVSEKQMKLILSRGFYNSFRHAVLLILKVGTVSRITELYNGIFYL
jgi:hypothetical protein